MIPGDHPVSAWPDLFPIRVLRYSPRIMQNTDIVVSCLIVAAVFIIGYVNGASPRLTKDQKEKLDADMQIW